MKKRKMYVNEIEWKVLYRSLNELKTTMIGRGFDTYDVDDLLYKVLTAKTKQIRVAG